MKFHFSAKGYPTQEFEDNAVRLMRRACFNLERGREKAIQIDNHRREPVTMEMISKLRNQKWIKGNIEDKMLYIGTVITFHFLFRISESLKNKKTQYTLLTEDVILYSANKLSFESYNISKWNTMDSIIKVIFKLRGSKTDMKCLGRTLILVGKSGVVNSHIP